MTWFLLCLADSASKVWVILSSLNETKQFWQDYHFEDSVSAIENGGLSGSLSFHFQDEEDLQEPSRT